VPLLKDFRSSIRKIESMANSAPLSWTELESRLLNWIRSAHIPRYPFFDGVPPSLDSSSSQYALSGSSSTLSSSSTSFTLAANNRDLSRWLEFVEQASVECGIEEGQYADVAVWFMRGELREVMRERRAAYLGEVRHLAESEKRARQLGAWKDFKVDLKRVVGALCITGSDKIEKWISRVSYADWAILFVFGCIDEAAKSAHPIHVHKFYHALMRLPPI
jgi:hypothetical protein